MVLEICERIHNIYMIWNTYSCAYNFECHPLELSYNISLKCTLAFVLSKKKPRISPKMDEAVTKQMAPQVQVQDKNGKSYKTVNVISVGNTVTLWISVLSQPWWNILNFNSAYLSTFSGNRKVNCKCISHRTKEALHGILRIDPLKEAIDHHCCFYGGPLSHWVVIIGQWGDKDKNNSLFHRGHQWSS